MAKEICRCGHVKDMHGKNGCEGLITVYDMAPPSWSTVPPETTYCGCRGYDEYTYKITGYHIGRVTSEKEDDNG